MQRFSQFTLVILVSISTLSPHANIAFSQSPYALIDDVNSGNKNKVLPTEIHLREIVLNEGRQVASRSIDAMDAAKEVRLLLPVKNATSEPLVLKRTSASCGCLVLKDENTEVAAQTTKEFTIDFRVPPVYGKYRKSLAFQFSNKKGAERIVLEVHIEGALTAPITIAVSEFDSSRGEKTPNPGFIEVKSKDGSRIPDIKKVVLSSAHLKTQRVVRVSDDLIRITLSSDPDFLPVAREDATLSIALRDGRSFSFPVYVTCSKCYRILPSNVSMRLDKTHCFSEKIMVLLPKNRWSEEAMNVATAFLKTSSGALRKIDIEFTKKRGRILEVELTGKIESKKDFRGEIVIHFGTIGSAMGEYRTRPTISKND